MAVQPGDPVYAQFHRVFEAFKVYLCLLMFDRLIGGYVVVHVTGFCRGFPSHFGLIYINLLAKGFPLLPFCVLCLFVRCLSMCVHNLDCWTFT